MQKQIPRRLSALDGFKTKTGNFSKAFFKEE
jgi:hypothetical protein